MADDSAKDRGASRRDFLKLAGTTAPIAAVAVAASGTEAEASEPDLTSYSGTAARISSSRI